MCTGCVSFTPPPPLQVASFFHAHVSGDRESSVVNSEVVLFQLADARRDDAWDSLQWLWLGIGVSSWLAMAALLVVIARGSVGGCRGGTKPAAAGLKVE